MTAIQRYDIYRLIHKGLRFRMAGILQQIGCVDSSDDEEFSSLIDGIASLLKMCQAHVKHENHFVHSAMEARAAGSSQVVADQHLQHEQELATLISRLDELQRAERTARAELIHHYYRDYALWLADNFVHMEQEEREHNACLWTHYSDAEIQSIENNLVASIAPHILPLMTQAMLEGMSPDERSAFLATLQAEAPKEIFDATVSALAPALPVGHWKKLQQVLGLTRLAQAV